MHEREQQIRVLGYNLIPSHEKFKNWVKLCYQKKNWVKL